MFYYLSETFDLFGPTIARLMYYISVRAGLAFVLALIIGMAFGEPLIKALRRLKAREIVRNLHLEGEADKAGTPTMGGIIIILSILVPVLLVGNLANIYMLLMIVTTIWLGLLGFLDDYLKLKRNNKDGLKGVYKIIGQVALGLVVGLTVLASPDIVVRENVSTTRNAENELVVTYSTQDIKAPITTIPFVKNHNFNYAWVTEWMGGEAATTAGWVVFIIVVIIAVGGTSNGANLTDGLDGLCTGVSAIIGVALLIMAYLGGNIIYASYLNIMFVPLSSELVVYMAAFIGALIGFLWYNAPKASIFMGDTGSLTIGGVIAVFAILIRKELLIPILCGVFLLEALSTMVQTGYYKYSRARTGTPKRLLRCAPLHHHFQKDPSEINAILKCPHAKIPESKIVIRFWIVGILLAVITFVTLKIR